MPDVDCGAPPLTEKYIAMEILRGRWASFFVSGEGR